MFRWVSVFIFKAVSWLSSSTGSLPPIFASPTSLACFDYVEAQRTGSQYQYSFSFSSSWKHNCTLLRMSRARFQCSRWAMGHYWRWPYVRHFLVAQFINAEIVQSPEHAHAHDGWALRTTKIFKGWWSWWCFAIRGCRVFSTWQRVLSLCSWYRSYVGRGESPFLPCLFHLMRFFWKKSTCSKFNALEMQNKLKFKGAVITGVLAVECMRHIFSLLMVDLQKGER